MQSISLDNCLDSFLNYLIVERGQDRYTYVITFEGKRYKVNNLDKLKATVESLDTGGIPRPQMLQSIWELIKGKKPELFQYVRQHYLVQMSGKSWFMDIRKDTSHIYIRFYIKPETPEELGPAQIRP